MPEWLSVSIAFGYGAIVGSFLNVLIWRLPRDESVVRPPSHCPVCGYVLKPWDNVPILTWLFYRGRCRSCNCRIPSRYFWVEMITALLWVAVYSRFGWSLEFFKFAALISTFIAVFFIDLEHYIIPDQLWIFAAVCGIAADVIALVAGWSNYPWNGLLHIPVPFTSFSIPMLHSVAGFFAYGLLVFVVGLIGEALFKKEAMGGGDIKLTAAIGANIGAAYGIISFFLSAGVGAVIGIALMISGKMERMEEIPFGPMLVSGAALMLFFGKDIINWWLGYAGLR